MAMRKLTGLQQWFHYENMVRKLEVYAVTLTLKVPKKQATKFVCKIKKKFLSSKVYHIENANTGGPNSVGPDEVAHYEPPHHDLHCLQI